MSPIQASTADPSVHELQERIVHLEKSLLQAHIELACTKSNEDSLKVEVARMSSIIASHDENNYSSSPALDTDDDEDYDWCTRAGPSYSVPIAAPRNTRTSSTQHDENEAPRRSVTKTVDTVDPFSRKKKLSSNNSSSRSSRVSRLNPGSCGSALNLFAFAEADCNSTSLSSRQGSMASLHGCLLRRSNNSAADSRNNLSTSRSRNLLNPNSCASALNLLEGSSGSDSLRNMSMASLLRDQSSLLRVQQLSGGSSRGSGLDILSGLMGTSRLASGNSLSRQAIVGARANSRSRLSNRGGGLGGGNGGGNQNEEWGVFE